MPRAVSFLLPLLALLVLAAFAVQLALPHAEAAGVAVCCGHDADSGGDGDGHCCSHVHASPTQLSASLSVPLPRPAGREAFRPSDLAAPEGPFRSIDQPPKLA